jgi:hypothetical protein
MARCVLASGKATPWETNFCEKSVAILTRAGNYREATFGA